MRRLTAFTFVLSIAALDGQKPARACPPTVRLAGDRALIAAVAPVLIDRGIATETNGCLAVSVNLEPRGRAMIVSIATDGDQLRDHLVERAVTDTRTAATVIESWVRTDLQAPLLARHPMGDDTGPKKLVPVPAVGVAPSAPPARGVHVFAAGETALASDSSTWFGLELGACVMLGPACASARGRFATVGRGPERWRRDLERHGVELLLGADLPRRIGRAVLSPGLAAGVGWIHTHEEGSPRRESIGGLRAQGRLALSYPLTRHLAAELALSFEVTDTEHVETSSPEPLPPEPRWLGRLGAGMRFEGL